MNKKGFVPILILLGIAIFVLIGGVVVYQNFLSPQTNPTPAPTISPSPIPSPTTTISPTPDQTAGWKTYTNSILDFKYPQDSDWKTFPSENFSVAAMCETCLANSTVDLFQITPVNFKSIDDYMTKDTLSTDKKKVRFSNLDAIKGVQSGGPQAGGSFITVFVVYKNQGYLMSERFRRSYDKNSLDQLPLATPDILSTFKFLN